MNAHRIIIFFPPHRTATSRDKDKEKCRGISSSLKPCKTLFTNTSGNFKNVQSIKTNQKKKGESLKDVKLAQTRVSKSLHLNY